MKQIILTLFVPLVLASPQCGENPVPEVCTGPSILCDRGFDANGCKNQDTCKTVDPHQGCSAREVKFCPCPEGKLSCPKGLDPDGCNTKDQCLEFKDSSGCTNYCPCLPDKKTCRDHLKPDADGCYSEPKCLEMKDQNGCPSQCPIADCADDEMKCTGEFDYNGCPGQEQCLKAKIANYDGTDGTPCNNYCPISCAENEIKCTSNYNDQGCPIQDTCHQKVTCGVNEKECDVSAHCPQLKICIPDDKTKICRGQGDEACKFNERLCAMGMDANGCTNPQKCVPKNEDCPVV